MTTMTSEHEVTPRLSDHARERCVEMGLTTRTAKRIYQHRTMTRPSAPGSPCKIVSSQDYPDYMLVVDDVSWDVPRIITVLYRSEEWVTRGEGS